MFLDDSIEIDGVSYKIFAEIGEGTSGIVYTVTNPMGRKFAMKVINDYGRNPILREMIDRQIQIQKRFKDNYFIINIYGSMQRFKKMYILFQLGTCSLRRLIELNTHIDLREFLDICLDTSRGLMAVHNEGYIHRDIKPENIICVEKTYKITDFGSLQGGTVGQGLIGTPLYLAPEMLFEEGKEYNQKIDVWSLGVTLFQTYFRIHPFYYLSEIQDHKTIYSQLKKHIKSLLPRFTIQKFLSYVSNFIPSEKIQQLKNKLSVTPPEMLQQFSHFFKYVEQRPDIAYFVCVFESLVDPLSDRKPNKSKVKHKLEELPFDIKFYVDTLNLFYDLSFRYGTQKFKSVEFHLQLGLWYWNFYNYLGQSYLSYANYAALKQYRKDKHILWQQVKSQLVDYWLQISTNKELQFFSQLPVLKVRILLCGAMFDINSELTQFLKAISHKVELQILNFEMLVSYLSIFQVRQLKKIQETLTNRYYYK